MMKRFNTRAVGVTAAATFSRFPGSNQGNGTSILPAAAPTFENCNAVGLKQQRELLSGVELFKFCFELSVVVCWMASMFNNGMNLWTFGAVRFDYQWDEANLAVDYKNYRYMGGLFGVIWWWYLVMPWKNELEGRQKWQPMWGPF